MPFAPATFELAGLDARLTTEQGRCRRDFCGRNSSSHVAASFAANVSMLCAV
jgi:hypothetical protein